jgi:arylsulfatase A-like enzyme
LLKGSPDEMKRPNVVFVFADQMRAQATGYAGDPNVKTPYLDSLAAESINFTRAVAGCPVCSPYRASLLTGQYPLTHGVFVNDVYLNHNAVSIADAFNGAGYDTAYVGKWHVDGHGRSAYIPRARRQGFSFWKVLECTHDYKRSPYYADEDTKLYWEGYDAIAQTREAVGYIKGRPSEKPFALVLSWGPPHNPYETAPQEFRRLYDPGRLILRPNVPEAAAAGACKDLAGYYAHISALDFCMGEIVQTLRQCGLEDNTILVFTSDHGDMLGSQGTIRKQKPWDEAILVPFLLRYPAEFGRKARVVSTPFNAPDIMPTLLGLCGIEIPKTVEGVDFSGSLRGEASLNVDATLIACYHPFGEWLRVRGGKEYRGVRTERYTYVRDRQGPWLLYDNEQDPYQLVNLCSNATHRDLQQTLETALTRILQDQRDEFLPGEEYIRKWGYPTDATGTVPFRS